MAWLHDNSEYKTHPVGQKRSNELGLYDMSGNVWEWCLDDGKDDSSKLTAEFTRGNDRGGSGRAFRGGCWNIEARYCRSAFRHLSDPGLRSWDLGFRVALVQLDKTEAAQAQEKTAMIHRTAKATICRWKSGSS